MGGSDIVAEVQPSTRRECQRVGKNRRALDSIAIL